MTEDLRIAFEVNRLRAKSQIRDQDSFFQETGEEIHSLKVAYEELEEKFLRAESMLRVQNRLLNSRSRSANHSTN